MNTSALPMLDGEYPDYGGTYAFAPDSTYDDTLREVDW